MKYKIILLLILVFAFTVRMYGIDWDQGNHLHPDERAITMFTMPLKFPTSLNNFLSAQSSWNPHFFAYGNFPLYFLKLTASTLAILDHSFLFYEKINLVGRMISVFADIGTLVLLYFLAKKLFNQKVALLTSFFYAISVFSIQAAHFYAVDALLTFFIILTLFQLIRLYENLSFKNSMLTGIFFGLSLATKTSALALVASTGAALTSDFILIFIKNFHRPKNWLSHFPKFLENLFIKGAVVGMFAFITFLSLEPYALLDFKEFWKQTLEQSQMTHNAFIFPYTLQYVGKTPYLYEVKNIFLWGQGPILATISFLGIFYIFIHIVRKNKDKKWAQEFILLFFFLTYFAVVGKFAVGWMRYMLPIYPLLCLFGAFLIYKIDQVLILKIRSHFVLSIIYFFSLILVLIWPISFINIYTRPNTRVTASDWINKNIPNYSTIATEHWDDKLPLNWAGTNYKMLELPIYEMENPLKNDQIYKTIQESTYVIIASNRLYVPLQRIANNCQRWNVPSERCPKNANTYYQKLFDGELGFKKIAEFSVYPKIPFLNITIDDQSADESFTVYDHPKILIFKKNG